MVPEPTLLEAETRRQIDARLIAAGRVVQDKAKLNLFETLGFAVREMDTGPADYMLLIKGKTCGIIEAERNVGTLKGSDPFTLSGF